MGRLPYLTRLALGRSIFERHATVCEGAGDDANGVVPGSEDWVALSGQRFDESGAPVNPNTHAVNTALIRAKNEVYEAVGVTERKHERRHFDLRDDGNASQIDELEDELGDLMSLTIDLVHTVTVWWAGSLRRRIVAGLVDTSLPFSQILTGEWQRFLASSLTGRVAFLVNGMEMELLANLLSEATHEALYGFTRFPSTPATSREHASSKSTLDIGHAFLSISVDLLLCPFMLTSSSQRLGLSASGTTGSLLGLSDWYHVLFAALIPSELPPQVRVDVWASVLGMVIPSWLTSLDGPLRMKGPRGSTSTASDSMYTYEALGWRACNAARQPFVSMRQFIMRGSGWSPRNHSGGHRGGDQHQMTNLSRIPAEMVEARVTTTMLKLVKAPAYYILYGAITRIWLSRFAGGDETAGAPLHTQSLWATTGKYLLCAALEAAIDAVGCWAACWGVIGVEHARLQWGQ